MLQKVHNFFNRCYISPTVMILLSSSAVIVYLTARNIGMYPVVFADEYFYDLYSRLTSIADSPRPNYLFFLLYRLTNVCGDGFLDGARLINAVFFALSLPLIYSTCRRFASASLSIFVALCAILAPINSYSAYFMPESMYFFFFNLLTWFIFMCLNKRPVLMASGGGLILACMSTVKPHAMFLFPGLIALIFSGWFFDRNLRKFILAVFLSSVALLTFFLIRLPLGYLFAGTAGLNLMGQDYSGIASTAIGVNQLINLLPLAMQNFWGHLLAVALLFGVPLAIAFSISLDKSAVCSFEECKLRALKLYTVTLMIVLLCIVALFSAAISNSGPYESIGRLSLRAYNFIFPLLLIIAASTLTSSYESKSTSVSMKLSLLAFAGLVVYALISRFKGYSPNVVDSPELLFTYQAGVLLALGGLGLVCLLLSVFKMKHGIVLYLVVFLPLMTFISALGVSENFRHMLTPNVYDQAGQFANRYLGRETSKLVIIGPDIGNLYRTLFHLPTRETRGIITVPIEKVIDSALIPEGAAWVLLIGNYQYSFEAKEKIPIPVKNIYRGIVGHYSLLKISDTPTLQITPSWETPHTTGKFDPAVCAMISKKGQEGTLMYGPYSMLAPGHYQATYLVTAESTVDGTEVGSVDISGTIPDGIDKQLAVVPLKSARGEQIIKLAFDADDPKYLYQFRVWVNGAGNRVSVKSVQVEKLKGGKE
jgi:phosphoglycerol transferase